MFAMRQKTRKVFLVLCMAESRHVFKILVGKQQSRRKLNNRMHGRNSNIKLRHLLRDNVIQFFCFFIIINFKRLFGDCINKSSKLVLINFFCRGHHVVFIKRKDNKTVSGFSKKHNIFLFLI